MRQSATRIRRCHRQRRRTPVRPSGIRHRERDGGTHAASTFPEEMAVASRRPFVQAAIAFVFKAGSL